MNSVEIFRESLEKYNYDTSFAYLAVDVRTYLHYVDLAEEQPIFAEDRDEYLQRLRHMVAVDEEIMARRLEEIDRRHAERDVATA